MALEALRQATDLLWKSPPEELATGTKINEKG